MSVLGAAWRWRHLLGRRLTQGGVLLLFWGTLHHDWQLFGRPLLRGDLSASELLGALPLADPLALLQILATGRIPGLRVIEGGLLVLGLYLLLGGRTFCAWVCPVNPVADLAGWTRRRLGLPPARRWPKTARFWALGLALLLSAATGVAAFELVSPIGLLHREVIFGFGAAGLTIVVVLFVVELTARSAWCGSLCPLGAFYSLVGRKAQLRIGFDAASCSRCGDCFTVCPEPQVLDLDRAAAEGFLAAGDCTNCGRCIPACPGHSLTLGSRLAAARRATSTQERRRAA